MPASPVLPPSVFDIAQAPSLNFGVQQLNGLLSVFLQHDPTMQEFHFKVLKLLEENPEISQRELARKLGMSLGKANYCLRALVEKGFVKAARFSKSDNKAAYIYVLTPAGIEEKINATAYFLKRKLAEYELLEKEIALLRTEMHRQGRKPEREDA